MSESNLPEWEQLLSAAAHLQEILPEATLVGGTAVAIFAHHRLSRDADHVLPDLRSKFADGESPLQQLQVQLSNPMPYDLEDTDLSEYRKLHPKWHNWNRVKELCATIAVELFKRL